MTLAQCSCGEKYLVENISTHNPCPKCIKTLVKTPKATFAPQQGAKTNMAMQIANPQPDNFGNN